MGVVVHGGQSPSTFRWPGMHLEGPGGGTGPLSILYSMKPFNAGFSSFKGLAIAGTKVFDELRIKVIMRTISAIFKIWYFLPLSIVNYLCL